MYRDASERMPYRIEYVSYPHSYVLAQSTGPTATLTPETHTAVVCA